MLIIHRTRPTTAIYLPHVNSLKRPSPTSSNQAYIKEGTPIGLKAINKDTPMKRQISLQTRPSKRRSHSKISPSRSASWRSMASTMKLSQTHKKKDLIWLRKVRPPNWAQGIGDSHRKRSTSSRCEKSTKMMRLSWIAVLLKKDCSSQPKANWQKEERARIWISDQPHRLQFWRIRITHQLVWRITPVSRVVSSLPSTSNLYEWRMHLM